MKRAFPLILLLMLTIAACDDRPEDVLSRGKMEDVLYDYHLMQGIIEQLPSNEREEKATEYMNAVYEKHGITASQFDASIVYYNRHPKDLAKIYSHLKDRYTAVNEEIQIVNGNNDMMAVYATGGDTTNLWNSQRLILLRNKELLNRESFTIHADTNFHRGDQFIFNVSPVFMKEPGDYSSSTCLCIGLSIKYANGDHIGTTRSTSSNTMQQLTLKADATKDIKSITGFLYYKGNKEARNFCLVDNISLIRMHEKKPDVVENPDSMKTDTLMTDTLPLREERRLTPEELRILNKSDKSIKIEAMPSVRTPNSIGPRRRTRQPSKQK